MSSRLYPSVPLLGACVAIWRDGRILLGERGKDPNRGTWAMPGGMSEVGETLQQTAIREVMEETSLHLEELIFNRLHEIIRHDEEGRVITHFTLAMFAAHTYHGEPIAGDDAADVRWFDLDEIDRVKTTAHTKAFALESMVLLGL